MEISLGYRTPAEARPPIDRLNAHAPLGAGSPLRDNPHWPDTRVRAQECSNLDVQQIVEIFGRIVTQTVEMFAQIRDTVKSGAVPDAPAPGRPDSLSGSSPAKL